MMGRLDLVRVVTVPFKVELSSVQVPNNQWNCGTVPVTSSVPVGKS